MRVSAGFSNATAVHARRSVLAPRWLIIAAAALLGLPIAALAEMPDVGGAAPQAPDTLWQRAVEIAGRNENWMPGVVFTRVEELDGHGNPKHVQESWVRLRAGTGGDLETEIVKVLKDGKDTTAEAQREEAELKQKEQEAAGRQSRPDTTAGGGREGVSLRFGGPSPFDPEVQDSVTYRRIDAPDPPPGKPCVAFGFAQQTASQTTLVGTAWLEQDGGMPLELRFTTDPLPKRVKEMSMTLRFAEGPERSWLPQEMHVEAMGKFLFFKKRFRSTMTFSEHWWKEEPSPPGSAADQ